MQAVEVELMGVTVVEAGTRASPWARRNHQEAEQTCAAGSCEAKEEREGMVCKCD